MRDNTSRPPRVLTRAKGAVMLLEVAVLEHDLPVPASVEGTDYAPYDVSLQCRSLEDLQAWAEWLTADVTDSPSSSDPGLTLHYAQGEVFDLQVRAFAATHAPAAVAS